MKKHEENLKSGSDTISKNMLEDMKRMLHSFLTACGAVKIGYSSQSKDKVFCNTD